MRDAGANSSKVEIPWKIRWELDFQSPFLSTRKGLFLFSERGEVEKMDMESEMSEGDMRGNQIPAPGIQIEKSHIKVHLPLLTNGKTVPSERMSRF